MPIRQTRKSIPEITADKNMKRGDHEFRFQKNGLL